MSKKPTPPPSTPGLICSVISFKALDNIKSEEMLDLYVREQIRQAVESDRENRDRLVFKFFISQPQAKGTVAAGKLVDYLRDQGC